MNKFEKFNSRPNDEKPVSSQESEAEEIRAEVPYPAIKEDDVRLTAPERFADIVNDHYDVRLQAVEIAKRSGNRELLEYMVKNEGSPLIRMEAIWSGLISLDVLEYVVRRDRNLGIREIVLEEIRDMLSPDVFEDLATDSDSQVRALAVDYGYNLISPDTIERLKDDSDLAVRRTLKEKMDNPE